jgi:hypothetical protein
MLTHWNKFANTDCLVVRVGQHTVYPIFRVGYTTLTSVCDEKYINGEIGKCDHIDVMIRDPEERFVSGINEYSRQNNIDVEDVWHLTNMGKLHDRHFIPQYIWLMHLYRYYKGNVTIRPFEYIKKITHVHRNKDKKKTKVRVLQSFVVPDYYLRGLYGHTLPLVDIVRRYKDVLS